MAYPSTPLQRNELPIEITKDGEYIIYMPSNLAFDLIDKIKPVYAEGEVQPFPMSEAEAETELNDYLSGGWTIRS